MKETELRNHAECSLCSKKIGESSLPLFLTVTVKRYGLKPDALQRQQGLAMMLGGSALIANAMGMDEDLAEVIDTNTLTICHDCSMDPDSLLMPVLYGEDKQT